MSPRPHLASKVDLATGTFTASRKRVPDSSHVPMLQEVVAFRYWD